MLKSKNKTLLLIVVTSLLTLSIFGIISTHSVPEEEGDNQRDNNIQLMARAIHGEARGEPYEGQVAVGAVILNRTRDPNFPQTIPGVVYQPLAFTAVADGQINIPLPEDASAIRAARDALNGWDPTDGCLYYWNPSTATSQWIWSRRVVTTIGKHNFGL